MSRFRGRWLDEEPEDDHDANMQVVPIARPPVPPVVRPPDPKPLRGRWLDGESEAALDADTVGGGFGGGAGGGLVAGAGLGGGAEGGAPVRTKVHPTPRWTSAATGVAGILLACLGLIAIFGNANVAKALIVAPVIAWIVYSAAKRLAEADGQPAIIPIMMGGLAVKFMGVLARYWIGLQVYGRSDATEYARYGRLIAPGLREFHLIDIGRLRGTNFIRLVTGVVFAITPASNMSGFLVFGLMSYIGMIFFWRAFKRAFPGTPDLGYLQVLLVVPSLAFWPSAIGKDAWMVMGVGIASYGVANILTNRTVVGWGSFIVGVYMVLAVRPQVGVALLVGLVLAELFRARGSQNAGRAGISIVLLLVFGSVIMSTTAAFLGIDNWSKASVSSELDSVGSRTGEGRSEFSPTPVNSPVQFPLGAFTVLFRPMPYEVHSPQEFLSSVENVALLGIIVFSFRRLLASLRRSRKQPYLLYCFGTLVTFIVEYSSFSNFALIARERTQITALLLVFICLPMQKFVEVDKPKTRKGAPKPLGSQ